MLATNLKKIVVKSPKHLTYLIKNGAFGVVEQRLDEDYKRLQKGSLLEMVQHVADTDTDNMYHVTENFSGTVTATILGIQLSKRFDDQNFEYTLLLGEDGVWETLEVDGETESQDGSVVGKLDFLTV